MPLNSYNIKTDGGAVGDGQFVTAVLTIAAGDTALHSPGSNLFATGDVGKGIIIDTLPLLAKISSYVSATQVILDTPAPSPGLSAVSTQMVWGTNDIAAFVSFNTACKGASGLVTLTLPSPGIYFLNPPDQNSSRWNRFISNLRVVSVGAGKAMLTGALNLGSFTMPGTDGGTYSVKLATVNPGDTTLQLLRISDAPKCHPGNTHTASDGSVYTSGTVGNLTGMDTEGFGDPTPQFREFVTIANVNDTTGLLTLVAPTKYQYLSTWPTYVPGSAFSVDDGGPATLYMWNADWDATCEFVGLQVWSPLGSINCPLRHIKFTNCDLLPVAGGVGSFFPATCETWTLDNTTFGSKTEVDKNIHQLNVINGSAGHRWWLQTAACENMLIDSSTIDQLEGTARFTTISNSTITTLILGPVANGCADSLTAINCVISAIDIEFKERILVSSPTGYSISGGRITAQVSIVDAPRWAMPGYHMFLGGSQEAQAGFNVLAVSGNGDPWNAPSLTFIDTDLNGWPPMQLGGGTDMSLITHPAPLATFINCTGCADAIDYSNPKAQGKPLYSYSNRTYAGVASGAMIALVNPIYSDTEGPRLWGTIVSVTVTVGTAFTTPGPLSLNLFGRFVTGAADPLTGNTTTWAPVVDLKTPGTRTITATAFNNLGADNLGPAPGRIHFSSRQGPWLNGTVAGGDPGAVTIEVQTDQGFRIRTRNLKGGF